MVLCHPVPACKLNPTMFVYSIRIRPNVRMNLANKKEPGVDAGGDVGGSKVSFFRPRRIRE